MAAISAVKERMGLRVGRPRISFGGGPADWWADGPDRPSAKRIWPL